MQESARTYEGLSGVKQTVEGSGSHVLIRNANNSIVVTSEQVPSSMHIKGGQSTVFKVEAKGPVFVHDLEDCDLVINCHQLRLHNLNNCRIWIDNVGNNTIIIENCRGLTIGRLDGGSVEVDDFDWPTKSFTNPHFKHATERIDYGWISGIQDGKIDR
ncbi:uncharacterized protein CANTADRAFT_25162 [Suhomyces tanzawaensis NRRL Y-17324]|uniref:C-CAP/cofactor C-like domain-containing protein n=1 Tax=Suhomyces tanzawaensis NRRL Y-17324 TaxID=984487 RepID=A0A1E4SMJ2_9ASCO|nr:uncharacterized protein CANTADRAFT_25162 [Suhomyces tanzawaensis NRRL Y-17324]ODV80746.1 hypothetical protein CANTADRAFT_25162 [Suhomyces tanzawaensis NRRL Y-17324]